MVPIGVGTSTSFSKPFCAPDNGIRCPPTSSANWHSPRIPLSRLARPIVGYHLSQFSNRFFKRPHTAVDVFDPLELLQLFYSRPKIVNQSFDCLNRNHLFAPLAFNFGS